jgi:hypothetical protein
MGGRKNNQYSIVFSFCLPLYFGSFSKLNHQLIKSAWVAGLAVFQMPAQKQAPIVKGIK